jgi:hypothetical protein
MFRIGPSSTADVARQAFPLITPKTDAKMAVGPATRLVTTSHVHGCRKKGSIYPLASTRRDLADATTAMKLPTITNPTLND